MNFIVSNESIAQQRVSPLAAGLTAVFEQGFDARRRFEKANRKVVENTVLFFKNELRKPLVSTIEKNTGLKIKNMQFSSMPDLDIHVMLSLNNSRTLTEVIDRIEGRDELPDWIKGSIPGESLDYKQLEKIMRSLNRSTGRLTKLKDKLGDGLDVDINIDLYSMLCSNLVYHESVVPFTPQECAAVVLHEIGHELSLIELCASAWHSFVVGATAHDTYAKTAPLEELAGLISRECEEAESLEDMSDEFKELVATIKKGGDLDKKLNDAIKQAEEDGKGPADVSRLRIAIGLSLSTIVSAMYRAKAVWYLSMRLGIRIVIPGIGFKPIGWSEKTSDVATNVKQDSIMEQLADEYVARHGMGVHLVSALEKLRDMTAFVDKNNEDFIQSKTYAKIQRSRLLFMSTVFGQTEGGYENDYNRAHRVKRNIIKALKNPELAADVKRDYVQQLAVIDQILKNQQKNKLGIVDTGLAAALGLLKKIVTLELSYDRIFDAGFRSKYNKFLQRVEELSDNPLHYRAAQIETS